MSTKNLLGVTLVAAFIMLTAGAQAQVPQVINYQGQLTDASGNSANGTFTMVINQNNQQIISQSTMEKMP
ncbi:hypothetical protein L0337_08410 [candidate division KSB1 bacterium]|nr:hypothetical protein [candidate division KSB1 bacterium]